MQLKSWKVQPFNQVGDASLELIISREEAIKFSLTFANYLENSNDPNIQIGMILPGFYIEPEKSGGKKPTTGN